VSGASFLARVRTIDDPAIRVVYWTILGLGTSYGLAISLVSVFLQERGVPPDRIGDLAIFFALGIVLLAVPSGYLIRRVGTKPLLVGSLLGYAVAVAAFPAVDSFAGFAALRFFDGAFSVCVWVSSETILLARAPRSEKAWYMSFYAIALALGYVLGPAISTVVVLVADKTASFLAAGALAGLTALFVASKLDGREANQTSEDEDASATVTSAATTPGLTIGTIAWRIKMCALATFSYGYFQASLVLFLPLYLQTQGHTETNIILTPAFFAAGMLLFANQAAKLGDQHGHLLLMRILGAVGVVAIVGFLFVETVALVFASAFVAGASLASVSPVSLALQGAVIPERDLSRAGGLYNAAYAAGMLVGPKITGELFREIGGQGMLLHFGALWSAFVVLTVVFRRDDPRSRGSLRAPGPVES
jgi:MFS family permease